MRATQYLDYFPELKNLPREEQLSRLEHTR
jgi:hypothetical protein